MTAATGRSVQVFEGAWSQRKSMFLTVKVYWMKRQVDDRLRLAAREPKGFYRLCCNFYQLRSSEHHKPKTVSTDVASSAYIFLFARFTPASLTSYYGDSWRDRRDMILPELPRRRNVSPWSSSSCWAWCLGQMWVIMRRMLFLGGCAYRPQFLSHRHQHVLLGPLEQDPMIWLEWFGTEMGVDTLIILHPKTL